MKTLFILIFIIFSAVNVHSDVGHGKSHDMSDGQMEMDMPRMEKTAKYEYIRAETPAGFNAVIGTKNHLEELQPELVTEKGQPIKVFTLTVKDVEFDIFPDKSIKGWGFNGNIPGPTIRVTEGDRIRIILKNDTDKEHTVHVHGQSKPLIADGVPFIGQKGVKKGGSHAIEFTVMNIGTSWYHCHVDSSHHVDICTGLLLSSRKRKSLNMTVNTFSYWTNGPLHMFTCMQMRVKWKMK